MSCPRPFRLAMVALVPVAAISLGFAAALAQPAPTPPAATTPAAPANTRPGSVSQPDGRSPPAAAATPEKPPSSPPAPVQTADPFGEEITLAPKTVVAHQGHRQLEFGVRYPGKSLKSLSALLDKQGIKPSGNSMIVYTSTDDTGFTYLAEIPVDQEPKNLTKAMSMGKSPEGKALKTISTADPTTTSTTPMRPSPIASTTRNLKRRTPSSRNTSPTP